MRAIAFVMYIYISSVYELILAQILLGISLALSNPAFDYLFSKHADKNKELAEWGGWEGFTMIATGCAALVGGFVIKHYGYTTVFSSMAVISVLLGIFLLRTPKNIL